MDVQPFYSYNWAPNIDDLCSFLAHSVDLHPVVHFTSIIVAIAVAWWLSWRIGLAMLWQA